MLLDEASVTATETTVMAATLAPGRTTIFNAACEPHVQDLCRMLAAMGARIEGIGTNLLTVEGVERLQVGARVLPAFLSVVDDPTTKKSGAITLNGWYVVDDEGVLHGIVTVDDAIDLVLPLAWKKRLPRIFH